MRPEPTFPPGWEKLAWQAIDEADTAFAVLNLSEGLSNQARAAVVLAWKLVQDARAATYPDGGYAQAVAEARKDPRLVASLRKMADILEAEARGA
jgi:hypothetical protein